MTNQKAFFIILTILISSGCSNRVYFGTSTRWALDASSTTVGLGYKASQFAYVPPKENGGEYSVLGKSDVDISISDIVVEEEFATGQAAECAAAASNVTMKVIDENKPTTTANLIFGSYISASFIDLNFGAENPFAGASIGYKRETATVIPITKDGLLRSVYAKTNINSLANSSFEQNGTKTKGIRFKQVFATGKAAVFLARSKVTSITNTPDAQACTPQ